MVKDRYKSVFLLILAAVGMAVIFLLYHRKVLFGSDIDWIAQHSVFPDYFRKLFYKTGELYPDFAMEIGGGQNIFNFAYYGLLNPCILLSYLFPGIPMDLWIMGLSFILYVISVILFYYWVTSGKKINNPGVCFGITLIFLLAEPLLYHSCVQIMFVNYMPFLCMGLIGTDRYFEKQKAGLLCLSVLFMILTSFYFSIGGIGCLCLYALYCYMKKSDHITVKEIVWAALKYISVIAIGILLSGFFLAPTAIALFEGRSEESGKEAIDILSLFLPLGEPKRILYDNYGMGLGCLSFVAITAGIFMKNLAGKVLSISLFLVTMFPVFTYILNGCLYNRGKVLIPFIPLVCFQTGIWLSTLNESKNRRGLIVTFALILLYFSVTLRHNDNLPLCLIDLALVSISILIYCGWKQNIWVMIVPAVFVLLLVMGESCQKDNAGLKWSDLNLQKREEISQMIEKITDYDDSLYRTEYYGNQKENFNNINRIFQINQKITSIYSSTFNPFYSSFRNDIFDVEKPNRNILMEGLVENVVFRKMMGVKYIISDMQPVGYQKMGSNYSSEDKLSVYVDETAAPLAYGTSKLMKSKEYEQLEFPYNQLIFLNKAVIEYNTGYEIENVTENEVKNMTESELENEAESELENRIQSESEDEARNDWSIGELKPIDFSGDIEGSPQGEVKAKIPKSEKNRILFLQFHVNNKKNKDVIVSVGTSRNSLCAANHIYYNKNTVFSYAVAISAGQEEILFDFGEGEYEVSDSEAYLISIDTDSDLYQYQFIQKEDANSDTRKTSEVLSGSVNMETEGYLITSIPYDEHFSVLVDGKETIGEMVNKGFLGIKLGQGNHEVVIQYQSPGKKAGTFLSLCGLLIVAGTVIKDFRRMNYSD